MTQAYVRIHTIGRNNDTGYKLNCDIVTDFEIELGFDTIDLSVTGSTNRQLFPISGLKQDPTFNIELYDDGTNKAFSITSAGVELAENKVSIKDQINFFIDYLVSERLGTEYAIYFSYLDRTFYGVGKPRLRVVDSDSATSAKLQFTLKVGQNLFGVT